MNREEFELNYENILNSIVNNGVGLIWDSKELKLVVDDKIKNIIGEYDIENQTLGQFLSFVHEKNKREIFDFFTSDLGEHYLEDEQIQLNYKVKRDNGNVCELLITGKVIKNSNKYYVIGKIYFLDQLENKYTDRDFLIENWRQIFSNKTINSAIQRDRITGLPNEYYFKNMVSILLKNIGDNDRRSAMLIIDLDNFKYINDSFGHEFGDLLLKEISSDILSSIPNDVLMCRYSGDEFLLFKPDVIDVQEVVALCNSIAKTFEKPNIVYGKKIYLTTSIGVSLSPDHGIDYSTLLKNADAAMYEAKKNGKNECDFFDNKLSIELNRVYDLQKGLRTAIENDELYVMFQAKVSLGNYRVNGFEALARWKSEEFGEVSPVEFIPIAESSKMIIPIGSFILEEVFKKIKCLLNEGNDNFKIAVNLSEMQLREDAILLDFKKLIRKYKISPKYIEVEITESMLMKSFEKNAKILGKIKNLGISIALDDFGIGYSSLNYLTKLPIDVLKIDRSFVVDLMNNHKSKCIVENIIDLSHKLGIEVVAEGVENISQVEYLKEMLCDVVQGYYYSRPKMFDAIKNIVGKEI